MRSPDPELAWPEPGRSGLLVLVAGARLHEGEIQADEALVGQLVADQHPQWADLPVRRIESTGTDHSVFRLGDELVVRMPRIGWAEQQIARESTWLPRIDPGLPVQIPVPVAVGEPGRGFPFRWLVSPWVHGRDLLGQLRERSAIDEVEVARDLAGFLRSLRAIDGSDGPRPGKRGRALADRDAEVRAGIEAMAGELDADRALHLWDVALAARPWSPPPVWLHGDLLPGNLVVADSRLRGVIDWGACGVGDPACELMVAWSLSPAARAVLRDEAGLDDATWVRARGWVIEQAVPFIPYYEQTIPDAVAITRTRLGAALAAD